MIMGPSAKKTVKLREAIIAELFEYPGVTLTGADLEAMAYDISQVIPRVPVGVILGSIRNLAGVTLSEGVIKATAWRLAGGLDLLQTGNFVPVWTVNPDPEWVIIQVAKVSLYYRRNNNNSSDIRDSRSYRVKFIVITGSAAGLKTTIDWSSRLCSIRAQTAFGFSKPYGKYPFTNALDLTSMQTVGLLSADACEDGKPGFEEFKIISSTVSWNRSILKKRARIDFACPEQYTTPCNRCWRGYESCPAACRPKDMINERCADCGVERYVDADDPKIPCPSCFGKGKTINPSSQTTD